jgi:hypothetical protein
MGHLPKINVYHFLVLGGVEDDVKDESGCQLLSQHKKSWELY